jgi:hypothetical protein
MTTEQQKEMLRRVDEILKATMNGCYDRAALMVDWHAAHGGSLMDAAAAIRSLKEEQK